MNAVVVRRAAWAMVSALGLAFVGGCEGPSRPAAAVEKPKVDVTAPVKQILVDSEYYPGVFEAVDSVDIRAQVTGYLIDIPYLRAESFLRKGKVAKDDELFLIDPRPFQKTVERLEADAKALEAQVIRWRAEEARNKQLLAANTISREEFDRIVAARLSSEAQHEAALAQIGEARLKLEYCRITAPFAGRISRNNVSVGNLVSADSTLLTNLVSIDPIYVVFHVEERILQRYIRLKAEGKLKEDENQRTLIEVGLDDDPPDSYPHPGWIDFGDNRVDPNTGTYLLRGVLNNADDRFKPGYSARVRLLMGSPRERLLVPERAIGRDLDQRYVYVVGPDNKVAYRKVQTGRLYGPLRVIDEGLGPDDRVVVAGVQFVRPGMVVEPRVVASPSSGAGGARSEAPPGQTSNGNEQPEKAVGAGAGS